MIRNLIISGGVAHDYETTSRMLADILQSAGIESDVEEDMKILAEPQLQQFQVITLNCVRWSCKQTPEWSNWSFEIQPKQQDGLTEFLRLGKGLVALHAASINFDTWPEYGRILGGHWKWGSSGHGPYQLYKMHVADTHHPIARGVTDFDIQDELYYGLSIAGDIHVLVTTVWENETEPIAWINKYGSARIYYNALGHGPESFECKPLHQLLRQGVLWASKVI